MRKAKQLKNSGRCPDELMRMIQVANYVNRDYITDEVELYSEVMEILEKNLERGMKEYESLEELRLALVPLLEPVIENLLLNWPEDEAFTLRNEMFGILSTTDPWEGRVWFDNSDVVTRWVTDLCIYARDSFLGPFNVLRDIAGRFRNARKGIVDPFIGYDFYKPLSIYPSQRRIVFEGSVARISEPTKRCVEDVIVGLDCDRIRICEVCDRLFWATRLDSETDSKSCLNSLTQRRHRERNRDEINSRRRENYRNKKLGVTK